MYPPVLLAMGEDIGGTTKTVTLTNSFYMGYSEIPQLLWEEVWGGWPGYDPADTSLTDYGAGDDYPAYYISWYEAVAFCNLLTDADDSKDRF